MLQNAVPHMEMENSGTCFKLVTIFCVKVEHSGLVAVLTEGRGRLGPWCFGEGIVWIDLSMYVSCSLSELFMRVVSSWKKVFVVVA